MLQPSGFRPILLQKSDLMCVDWRGRLFEEGAAILSPRTPGGASALRRWNAPQRSRHAHHGRDRWWASHKSGEPLQVLCDRCQRKLELRAARSSQAQSAEPKNALEVREQHLDLFTVAA
jgi:hypothetical protein